MGDFIYQNLTKEMLDSAINDIFRQDSRYQRPNMSSYWQSLNLAYPSTPDESFKQKSIEIMKGNELDITITDRNRSYGDSRVYRYKINGESVLRFDQIPYPECCGIAIIKNFSANGDMQKADFLDAMDQFLADIKKNDRYSKVLFYTNAGSNGDKLFPMINGITILDPFRNKRSGNTLVGFEIDLLEKSTESGWRTLDLTENDDDFDEEEIDGEHDEDEEEDDDPFGLSMIAGQASLDQQQQGTLNGRRPITSRRGILDGIQASPIQPRRYDLQWGAEDEASLYNSMNPTGINRSSDNS